jgi:hypothetical protein
MLKSQKRLDLFVFCNNPKYECKKAKESDGESNPLRRRR